MLWTDGVFAHEPGHGVVGRLVRTIRGRMQRTLRGLGKLPAAEGGELLSELSAPAVQGSTALGERAGERDCRPGRGTRPFAKGPLCAELDGYALHAAVRVVRGSRRRGWSNWKTGGWHTRGSGPGGTGAWRW